MTEGHFHEPEKYPVIRGKKAAVMYCGLCSEQSDRSGYQ
jgi:hypothetical protein